MDLLSELHKNGAFKLGQFVLKSGQKSSFYIDLRTLISSPDVLSKAAQALCDIITEKNLDFDYIVGVPYAAMPLATLVCHFLKKPMLLKRKEAKSYGTKKLIEGAYENGKKALIIEDVVTTGSSIIETIEALRNEGLVCEHVLCIIDREQGGDLKLQSNQIKLHSITTMSKILDFLIRVEFITREKKTQILDELSGTLGVQNETNAIQWSLENRKLLLSKNPLNKHIIGIMLSKQTNLCLAADFTKTVEIIKIIQKVHPYICALKLHIDIIEDFSMEFLTVLKNLAQEHNFLLFEDRKFADTGKTMEFQLNKGVYKISSWANMVTLHSVAGDATISTFRETVDKQESTIEGGLLIAELSTAGALTRDFYTKETVEIAKQYPYLIGGFICQKRCHNDPSFLYWTPGVNQEKTTDGAGQQWRSIEQAILRDQNDIIIVGRAITAAKDVVAEAKRYAEVGWSVLITRVD